MNELKRKMVERVVLESSEDENDATEIKKRKYESYQVIELSSDSD